ncbi:hypothetical protein Tco_0126554 [Tanacetum coccineum]
MLKVSPWKGVVRFGKRGKLNPRYVRPFKVLGKVGEVSYKLELLEELSRVHNTFHVSNLKKCYADEPLAVPLDGLHFDDKLQFVEEPVEIVDREVKRLKRSHILLIKVRWNSKRGPEYTWECEDQFKKKYPHLFTKIAPSSSVASVDLNDPKDSSKTDKAAQNVVIYASRTPKSLTLKIHHGRWFTLTPSRSYIGGHVSLVNVVDTYEFCLHDLKDMVVKLGYGVEDLIYCHFLIPSLGLDYGLHSLNVDADVLEMSKYVKDYKIILVYVEHGSSIFVTLKKGISIAVNNHLRKGLLDCLIMVKLSVDLNEPKDSSKTDKAAQNGRTPKSLTLKIHHGRWFTLTPSRSYIGGHVSLVNVVDTYEFCLHDLKDMVVKLVLNVDADVLEMSKYVKDYKIILVYVEHGSSIFVTLKKGISIAVNNHLRKGLIEIDSSPYVNKTLTPMCHRNLTKEWEQPSSSVEAPIVVECAEDPFEELDDLLGKRYCVRHIHENMKSQFKGGVYKEMLWNAAKATSEGEFKKKMGELKSFNSDAYDWLMKIPLEQWSRAYFSGRAKCDLLINNICEVFNRQKWKLTGIPCKHVVAAIYNMSENSIGVGIPEQWVHAAYRLETWAHVYSFKVNPCNGRDMWPVVESRTVIIPPLYKPLIGRPPKKRKKSNDEIASQSASSGKLSRKGKSVSCGKYGNVGHNRKGYRGQGGGSSQAGARKVSGQAAGATNVSGQAVGARKVSGQAASATNISCQAAGARKVSSQAADARKASSQPGQHKAQ